MEIISKKKLYSAALWLLLTLILAGGAIVSVLFLIQNRSAYYIMSLILFLLSFIICLVGFIIAIKPPHILITYENGVLRFADGLQCTPRELQKVLYRKAAARYVKYSWGTLIVTVNGQDHKFRSVGNVEKVTDRLFELIEQKGK